MEAASGAAVTPPPPPGRSSRINHVMSRTKAVSKSLYVILLHTAGQGDGTVRNARTTMNVLPKHHRPPKVGRVALVSRLLLIVAIPGRLQLKRYMYLSTDHSQLLATREKSESFPESSEASREAPKASPDARCLSVPEDSSSQERARNTTYGLTVVHFHERNVSFLEEISPQWTLAVFETGGENVSRASIPFKNAGSEECTAYFEYMIQNYDNLPDITFFIQSDGLAGYKTPRPPR